MNSFNNVGTLQVYTKPLWLHSKKKKKDKVACTISWPQDNYKVVQIISDDSNTYNEYNNIGGSWIFLIQSQICQKSSILTTRCVL